MAPTFKAIIVGGGPTGLFAALCLQAVGIDFVLLEERNQIVYDDEEDTLLIDPASIRIFHQLGLGKKVRQDACAMTTSKTYTCDGLLYESSIFHDIKRANANYPHCFYIYTLLEILKRALGPSEDKLLVSKTVASIQSAEDGVSVKCEDGSVYNGSIVIGADGSRGKTAMLMREMALYDGVDSEMWEAEGEFPAEFRYMTCNLRRRCSDRHIVSETHSQDLSLLYMAEYEKASIIICEKLDKPTRESKEFTRDDEGRILMKVKDFIVVDPKKVYDIASDITTSSMSLLEEGVAKKWSYKRLVLVGDACHKVAPQGGLGFNMNIQDIVVLVNSLRNTVDESAEGRPTPEAITAAFTKYQKEREPTVLMDLRVSSAFLRASTWANGWWWLLSVYVFPTWLWNRLFLKSFLPRRIKSGQVLYHVSSEEALYGTGSIPWDNQMRR